MADAWREDILSGLIELKTRGVPGSIFVYGKDSAPILSDKKGRVFVAAGELRQGRVVVFSHDAYPKVLPAHIHRLRR